MIEAKWGLDQPVHVQYGLMIGNMMQGDFGRSIAQERPVFDIIMDAVPNTLMLSIVTLVVIYSTGILMGTIQAVKQYSFIDNALSVISLFFYSMPRFWLALMLVLIFALKLEMLPAAGMVDAVEHEYMSPGEQVIDRLKLLLPGIALGVASAAGTAGHALQHAGGHPTGLHPDRPRQGPEGRHRRIQACVAKRPAAHRHPDGPVAALPLQRQRPRGDHLRLARHGPHRGRHLQPGHPAHHRVLLRVHADGRGGQPAGRRALQHRRPTHRLG